MAAVAALILVACWVLLPVRLTRQGDGRSGDECLALADHPPGNTISLATLERCHAVVPADAILTADLAAAYAAAGRHADAIRLYREAVVASPDDADTRVALASVLLEHGSPMEAREQADAALRLQPNRAAIRALLDRIAAR